MYHQNHYTVEILAKARHEQLLEYAMRSNQSRGIPPFRAPLLERVTLRLGETLIFWGTWLKNRYQTENYAHSAALTAHSTNNSIS